MPASAIAQDCHWSGGTYSGEKANFQARFSVNEDCTEMNFESSGNTGIQAEDVPETFALTEEKHGWVANINGVTATLGSKGNFVNFIGEGVNVRLQVHSDE
ncbi:hypothetical protein [Sedimentitalea todarodis]|uniref:Uncharacterized protein n=1 Tax=Sedimentitalea todarodis TaxID=1631240 RepID=A0ABU3V956_9RHOB|nr:hypothetical protein [Sedimentitalea todarodis]MDU9002689.1 hypothetical protein [Sedimentitalea todarodis]